MFNREYVFYGKHAEYVKALTSKIMDEENITIFNRNVDVLLIAGIVGFVYGRVGNIDKSINKNKEVNTTKIFTDTMIKESNNLMYNYELIMLLHNRENDDIEIRLDRAFRYLNKGEEFKDECMNIFNRYVLGGVEVLYERIIKDGENAEDYLDNLYQFIEEFNMKYNPNNELNREEDLRKISKIFN